RAEEWNPMDAITGNVVAEILAAHVLAGDDDAGVPREQLLLTPRPRVLRRHHVRPQLPASARQVVDEASGPADPRAGLELRKRKRLVAADARAEISVHHLERAPSVACGDEPLIDLEQAHVVREADIGPPRADAGHRTIEAFVGHTPRVAGDDAR